MQIFIYFSQIYLLVNFSLSRVLSSRGLRDQLLYGLVKLNFPRVRVSLSYHITSEGPTTIEDPKLYMRYCGKVGWDVLRAPYQNKADRNVYPQDRQT